MTIAVESFAERLSLKRYASGAITAATIPTLATGPGVSGSYVLRHRPDPQIVLNRTAFADDEVRTDRIMPMEKLGTKTAQVNIPGLLSLSTWDDLFEAVLGGTFATAGVSDTQAAFTSVKVTGGTFVFTTGNPVTEGYRVGDVVQFSGLSATANNGVNFYITGFSGTQNRIMSVYPTTATAMTADTAFGMQKQGKEVYLPTTGPVERKYAVEIYHTQADVAEVAKEVRFGTMNIAAAANQDARIDVGGLGRDVEYTSGGSAPYFSGTQTAVTTTPILNSMEGFILVGGAIQPCSAASVNINRPYGAPPQMNTSGAAAGIMMTANTKIDGEFTVYLTSNTLRNYLRSGTTVALMIILPELGSNTASEVLVMYLAQVRITSVTPTTIEGARALTCRYTTGTLVSAGNGEQDTPLRILNTRK